MEALKLSKNDHNTMKIVPLNKNELVDIEGGNPVVPIAAKIAVGFGVIGVGVAVGVLAAYGAYKLTQYLSE
tara:strand:- start:184 stop:396 length:213 start_codon:yes stop_codon:yes gene_type:complete